MERDEVRRWVTRHRYAVVVSLVAFVVMVYGTWRTAPHLAIPDEAGAVRKALRMGYERDPFIKAFKKGGNLHLYLLAASFVPVVALWVVSGRFGEITAATDGLPSEPSWDLAPELLGAFYDVMFAGRVLSALFGAATVFVVYLLARDLESERAGLAAAVTLTLSTGYVLTAHYATEDAPTTFFIMLTLLLLVRARREWGRYTLLAAALSFGLATSAKAISGLLVIPISAVIVERYRDDLSNPVAFLRRTWGYPALALGAYFATTPSIFLYPGTWFAEVMRYSSNVAGANVSYSWQDPAWLIQLAHLSMTLGLPLFLLGVGSTLAIAGLLARDRADTSLALLLSVAVPYFLIISVGKMAQFPRVIALLPFFAVFVGVVTERLYSAEYSGRRVALGALAVVFAFSALYLVVGLADFNTSRMEATAWNEGHFESGEEVAVYSQRIYLPEFPDDVTVNRYEIHSENPESNWRPGLEQLACNGPEHVVLSSDHYNRFFKDPSTYPEVTAQFRRLMNEDGYRIVQRFGPPIQTDQTASRKFQLSATFHSYHLNGSPTILVLKRTAELDPDCPATGSA